MSIDKINDTELYNQKRYHVNQADVPGKTAQEMKEFMDYIPRQVIIPKINDLTDAANAAASSESVYTKAETDGKLDFKADADDVYTKAETDGKLDLKANADDVYTKSETDDKLSIKADAADVYIKSETDNSLALKANAADVYTKSETDSALSAKLDKDSDSIIIDREKDSSSSLLKGRLYRNGAPITPDDDGGELYVAEDILSVPPEDGLAMSDSFSYFMPLPCHNTVSELIAKAEACTDWNDGKLYLYTLHANNDTSSEKTGGVYLALEDRAYFVYAETGSSYSSFTSVASVSIESWANGTANIHEDLYNQSGMSGCYLFFSSFGRDLLRKYYKGASDLATKEYVDSSVEQNKPKIVDVQINETSIVENGAAKIPLGNNTSVGVVRSAGTTYGIDISSATGKVSITKAETADIDARTNRYKPIVPYTLDYAVKAAMCDGKGENWTADEQAAARDRLGISGGGITEYPTIIDNYTGSTGSADDTLNFSDNSDLCNFLNEGHDIIKITLYSEMLGGSCSNRTFILTRCPTQEGTPYVYIGHGLNFYAPNDCTPYTVYLHTGTYQMWYM